MTNALQAALTSVPEDFTPTKRLVAATLFDVGDATAGEITELTGVSRPTVHKTLQLLVDAGLARQTEGPVTDSRGRDPVVFVGTPPAGDTDDVSKRRVRDLVICGLAKIHYRKGVSCGTASRIAAELSEDLTPHAIGGALRTLQKDGLVERLNRSQWRLTGAERVVPHTRAEAEMNAD